jgi:hypothetical protein
VNIDYNKLQEDVNQLDNKLIDFQEALFKDMKQIDTLKERWIRHHILMTYPSFGPFDEFHRDILECFHLEEYSVEGLSYTNLYHNKKIMGVFAYKFDFNDINRILYSYC